MGLRGHGRREDGYPLLLHAPYFDIYRKQVVKQADLVLAHALVRRLLHRRGEGRAFAYYEPITVRDSSLSACTQAVIAAEVGHLDLAHDYLTEAALMDLRDLEHNTRDGVHVASLAGAWIALVGRVRRAARPRRPADVRSAAARHDCRLRFAIRWREPKVRVEVTADQATYTLEDGPTRRLELAHHGTPFAL